MFTLRCYRPEVAPHRFTLAELFRFVSKEQHDADAAKFVESDDGADDLWSHISPEGNIYRLNALEAEHLKHRADLRRQLDQLADEQHEILDAALQAEGSDITLEARRAILLEQLSMAPVKYLDGLEEGSANASGVKQSFLPVREFLLLGGVQRYWYLGGMLLPNTRVGFWRQVKNRFLGFVIAVIQACGPVMIFVKNWSSSTNYFKATGGISYYLTYRELTCFNSFPDFATTLLGTMFLYVVFEVCRGYTLMELQGESMMRYLPADAMWSRLGMMCNMTAILFTGLSMPLIFWAEMYPKEIVFDSLAMLFIFKLDDLQGGALDHLGLTNESFCLIRSWVTILLGQCPVYLQDIVNPNPKGIEDIWQIHLTSDGLVSSRTGAKCKTRLTEIEDEAAEEIVKRKTKLPLKKHKRFLAEVEDDDSPFAFPHFYYTVSPDDEAEKLLTGTDTLYYLWYACWYTLVLAEILVPPIFLVVNDPCYAQANPTATAS